VTSANINGGNPQRAQQLSSIDRDGTNLIQLTNAATGSIGTCGSATTGRVWRSTTTETYRRQCRQERRSLRHHGRRRSPRQITSSTAGHADSANISGDGNTIVFESTANYTGGNLDGGDEIFVANWTTGAITRLTSYPANSRTSRQPWPTNDGSMIYFSSDRFNATYEIWRVASDGTGLTRMTNFGQDAQHPVVSGDGSRFGTWLDGALYTGTSAGIGTETPLIVRDIPEQGYLDLSANGQKVTFDVEPDRMGRAIRITWNNCS
jgi:Tol biopolymer transport system component